MQPPGVLVGLLRRSGRFIVQVLTTTSAHGVQHLVNGGLHFLERLVWLSCITVAVYGMVALSQRIWHRFQTSPTVISMDRNMYLWNTSFPSLTICSHRRIDEEKLAAYVQLRGFDEDDAEQFREFVVLLANVSYRTFLELPMYKTFGIAGYEYMELLHNLSWTFLPQVISGTTLSLALQPTVTELGLCLSVNSRIAQYTSYEYWQARRWDRVQEPIPLVVHPLEGEVYGQLVKLASSYEVFFHGSMEVAEISKRQYSFEESHYTTVELMALEVLTSRNARELSVSQRQCRFMHEAETLVFSPVYSYNLCRMECRMKLASKHCGCVPHFYRAVGKGNFRYRICDFDGLRCLGQRADEMITLRSKKKVIECNCLPNCDDSNFFIQAHRSREWFLGANLQWGFTDYPKMQLRRDIIFGLSDVFVYIGGLGGFFLGCSLITFAEFIFFLTWRLVNFPLHRQQQPYIMNDENETCSSFIAFIIKEALRKLEVLSWCSKNQQLYDGTRTFSIATLLQDRRRRLHTILVDIDKDTDGHLPSPTSERPSKEQVFRASSSSGEERFYYDRAEYVERCREIRRLVQTLNILKFQCHELNQKLHVESEIEMTRHRFVKYFEASRKEQRQQTVSDRLKHLQMEHQQNKEYKSQGIEAAVAIEKFYHWKLESTEQQIEDWMNRFDREKEDLDSRFQKARATEKYWNELKVAFDQREQEIDVLQAELIRWEVVMKHKEMCRQMATKLQAWWRGVMVRRGIGRFYPSGVKKAKGKEKRTKQSKKFK